MHRIVIGKVSGIGSCLLVNRARKGVQREAANEHLACGEGCGEVFTTYLKTRMYAAEAAVRIAKN